jgi:hypothetical protein
MAQFLVSAILKGPGKILGENSHPQYNDSGASSSATKLGELKNRIVLFNSRLVRGVATTEIDGMLTKIIELLRLVPTDTVPNDMIVKLLVLAAYQRDIKDGKGERDIFYTVIFRLWEDFPEAVEVLLRNVIGSPIVYYKDVLLMIEKLKTDEIYFTSQESQDELSSLLFSIMLEALQADKARLDAGELPKTLVFKWAPRQQTHFDKTCKLARRFAYALFPIGPGVADHKAVMAKYRRMLSAGTEALKTVESYMCSGNWAEIDLARVPAKAMKNYRKAFMNVDKRGRQRSTNAQRKELAEKLIEFLASGKSIHGATLMPHEIITDLRKSYDPVLEAQLRNMIDEFVAGFPTDIGLVLAMCDVSASMEDEIPGSRAMCIDVSIALSFLLSRIPGPFFDKLLTFSADPIIIDLSDKITLYEKIKKIETIWDGRSTSTDFGKAMDYILRSLIDNHVDPVTVSDLTLVVFSDMQFDSALNNSSSYYGKKTTQPDWNVAHDRIEAMYKDTGFPTPHMVYWNLNARESAGHPAHAETKGVSMLSGFSQASLKTFLAGELVKDPEDVLPDPAVPAAAAAAARKDPFAVLCTSLEKYIWLMKKFEEAGVFPGFIAPALPTDTVAVEAVAPPVVEDVHDDWDRIDSA